MVLVFALFSPLWWLLIIAASVLIIWGLDNDRAGFSTFFLIAAVAALVLFGDSRLPGEIIANPGTVLLVLLGYFVGGGIWSLVKWSLFSSDKRDSYEDTKRNWLKDQGVSGKDVPDNLKAGFRDFLLDSRHWSSQERVVTTNPDGSRIVNQKQVLKIIPIAWEHKSQIITWMMYWPWSALWALIDDFVRKAFKRLQRALESLMDRIAQFHFRGHDKDFTVAGQPNEKILDPNPNYRN